MRIRLCSAASSAAGQDCTSLAATSAHPKRWASPSSCRNRSPPVSFTIRLLCNDCQQRHLHPNQLHVRRLKVSVVPHHLQRILEFTELRKPQSMLRDRPPWNFRKIDRHLTQLFLEIGAPLRDRVATDRHQYFRRAATRNGR